MPWHRVHLATTPKLLLTVLLASACGDGGVAPAPKATQLIFATEPSATAETMVPLGTQPVVQAADESGRSAPITATVTAEVLSGNGVVAAGGSLTTDAGGRAAFSNLTLGGVNGAVGPLTIQFSVPGLAPVTIAVELRCAVLPVAIGQTVNRALTTGDCAQVSGEFANFFELMTSQPVTAVRLSLGGLVGPLLVVGGPNEPSSNYWGYWSLTDAISFTALLPPGRIRVAVTTLDAGQVGSYSLTVAAASADLTCDDLSAVAVSPITTEQQLGVGDCAADSFLKDVMLVGMPPNAGVTVSMISGAFQPSIQLIDAFTGSVAASATATGTASLTFANGSAEIPYYLVLTSAAAGDVGAYTLNVNITYPSPAAAVAAGSAVPVPRLSRAEAGVMRRSGSALSGIAGPLSPMR